MPSSKDEEMRKVIEKFDKRTNGQFSRNVIEMAKRMNPSKNQISEEHLSPTDEWIQKQAESKEEFHEVNKSKHYNLHPSGIECIEVIRHYNFNIGNAMKYLWRQGLKDNNPDIKDMKKAIYYIIDEIQRLGGDTSDIQLESHKGIGEHK